MVDELSEGRQSALLRQQAAAAQVASTCRHYSCLPVNLDACVRCRSDAAACGMTAKHIITIARSKKQHMQHSLPRDKAHNQVSLGMSNR